MELISKAALIAEIENKIKKYTKRGEESDAARDGYGMHWGGVLSCLNEVRTLCDTLEVKEVDLKKELDEWLKYGPHTDYPWCSIPDAIEITAEHFFELGVKVKKGE